MRYNNAKLVNYLSSQVRLRSNPYPFSITNLLPKLTVYLITSIFTITTNIVILLNAYAIHISNKLCMF
jgi:hypothetical protein